MINAIIDEYEASENNKANELIETTVEDAIRRIIDFANEEEREQFIQPIQNNIEYLKMNRKITSNVKLIDNLDIENFISVHQDSERDIWLRVKDKTQSNFSCQVGLDENTENVIVFDCECCEFTTKALHFELLKFRDVISKKEEMFHDINIKTFQKLNKAHLTYYQNMFNRLLDTTILTETTTSSKKDLDELQQQSKQNVKEFLSIHKKSKSNKIRVVSDHDGDIYCFSI